MATPSKQSIVCLLLGALLGFLLGEARGEGALRSPTVTPVARRYGVKMFALSAEEQLRQEMEREDRTSVRAIFGWSMRASDAVPAPPPLGVEGFLLLASLLRWPRRGGQHG